MPPTQIAVYRVTVDGEERFTVLYDDASLNTVLGLDGPFTESDLRARLARLKMGKAEIEAHIALARAPSDDTGDSSGAC
jgi:hypothetical protein